MCVGSSGFRGEFGATDAWCGGEAGRTCEACDALGVWERREDGCGGDEVMMFLEEASAAAVGECGYGECAEGEFEEEKQQPIIVERSILRAGVTNIQKKNERLKYAH